MAGNPPRWIFHVDMDAFYASVEALERPGLKGKPLIIGGVDSRRGVVSSASYEARAYGVRSAMPVAEARRLCPDGIYLPARHDLYWDYSRRLLDVLGGFSPVVEQMSVDEACLDMTGTTGIFGPPAAAAAKLKAAVAASLGLTASVGAAPNRFLAKLASDVRKPDGLTVVEPGGEAGFLDPLPVERLWGVGGKTAPVLRRLGLQTIRQVRLYPFEGLRAYFGDHFAAHLHALARGEDGREVEEAAREKSISHERTFERDLGDRERLRAVLLDLSDRVAQRARQDGLAGRTVSLVWRDPDFSRHSRSRTLAGPTASGNVIYTTVFELFAAAAAGRARFRLIGVRLSQLGDPAATPGQLDLFAAGPSRAEGLDRALDAVRERFGDGAIRRGRLVGEGGRGGGGGREPGKGEDDHTLW